MYVVLLPILAKYIVFDQNIALRTYFTVILVA